MDEETKDLLESAQLDREAIELLAAAVVANRRLAWVIVDLWLKRHHKLLIDDTEVMQ